MASVRREDRAARASIWLADRPVAARRLVPGPAGGDHRGLDIGRIVAKTVLLLDAEGLGKLSMRRLASELGVTAMSVYWYVDTKDELLELALDSAHAELALPDGSGADWREQLRRLAGEHRRMLVAHPWVSRLAREYLNVGPCATAFTRAARRAMRRSGLPEDCVTGALALLFQFTYGFGTVEGRWAERSRATGLGEDEFHRDVLARLEGRPGYAEEVSAAEAGARVSVREARGQDFDFAVDCALAGIAAMRDRVTGEVAG